MLDRNINNEKFIALPSKRNFITKVLEYLDEDLSIVVRFDSRDFHLHKYTDIRVGIGYTFCMIDRALIMPTFG